MVPSSFTESSADARRAPAPRLRSASSLHSLGDIELEAGALDAAEAAYVDGLRIAWASGADRLIGYGVAGLAAVAGARGDADRAALFWGFVEAYAERVQFTLRGRTLYEKQLAGLVGTDAYEAGGGSTSGRSSRRRSPEDRGRKAGLSRYG